MIDLTKIDKPLCELGDELRAKRIDQLRKYNQWEREHADGRVHILDWAADEIVRLDARLAKLEALYAERVCVPDGYTLVPTEILDRFPEINPSNYDHDDACALNSWGVELILATAQQPPAADPFEGAPEWAEYITTDPDGSKTYHENTPYIDGSFWNSDKRFQNFIEKPNNWRNSKIQRQRKKKED